MSEDGSWWRRLGAALQPRSDLAAPAQTLVNASHVGRAQNTGVGFAALSVRSNASHRQRRSALENVRTTTSSSHLAAPSEIGPPQSILPPRSPSTPPTLQRKQQHLQPPRSCPSSPPKPRSPQPRSSSQPLPKPTFQPLPSPQLRAASPARCGGSPRPPSQLTVPQPSLSPQPQQQLQLQSPFSPVSTPSRKRQSTIAEGMTTPSPPQVTVTDRAKTPASPPPATESSPATQDLQPGQLLSSSGTPATSGRPKTSPSSPFSTTRSKRSSSFPRPVSALFSSPGSLKRHSQQSTSPPPSYSPPRASKEEYYHQRTHGSHILMHPSHRRRASSTGSLAEAANLLATRNQYSATLSSLIGMGYSKQRAEEALWKYPTKAAAYLGHQDHAGQDVLINDCEWCIPWLGLAHLIEIGSPPKSKPKLKANLETTATRTPEKPTLAEAPQESGSTTSLSPANKMQDSTSSPSKTEDSDKTRVDEASPTRKSIISHTSESLASVYSQETTTTNSIVVPVIGHANGENCQICKTAVGGVCQWSDWGWEHGKWEEEFLNEGDDG